MDLPTKSYAFAQRQQTAFVNPNRVLYDSAATKPQQPQHVLPPPTIQQQPVQTPAELNIPQNCRCLICQSWLTRTISLLCCQANVCQACFDQQMFQTGTQSTGPVQVTCPNCSTLIDQTKTAPNPRHDKIVAEARLEYANQQAQFAAEAQATAQAPQPQPLGPQQQQLQQQQLQQHQQQQMNQYFNNNTAANRFADVTCKNCDQPGHYPSHCPQPLREGVWMNPTHAERRKKWLQDQGFSHIIDHPSSVKAQPPTQQQQQGQQHHQQQGQHHHNQSQPQQPQQFQPNFASTGYERERNRDYLS